MINCQCFVLCRNICIPMIEPILPPKSAIRKRVFSDMRHWCFLARFLSVYIKRIAHRFIIIKYTASHFKYIKILRSFQYRSDMDSNEKFYFSYALLSISFICSSTLCSITLCTSLARNFFSSFPSSDKIIGGQYSIMT